MKIVVLCGWLSTERKISFSSGTKICAALRKKGHQAVLADLFLGLEDMGDAVLAHPERYMYMASKRYAALKAMGIEFQLNITALTGAYGPEVKSKAEHLLSAGMYNYCGTDLHRLSSFEHLLDAERKKKYLKRIP